MKSLLTTPRRLRSCLELESTDHFQGICQSVKGSGSSPGGPGHHRSQSMRGLTLTQREQARLQVLNSVLEHQIQVDGAAQVLGVSKRHLWRTLAAYRKEGAAALAHGNRGRPPRNATPEGTKAEVGYLARTSYPGANHTHLTELLAQREGIVLGRSTVRRILVSAGITSPRRRRPPRHRVRRQRMPHQGMLVQIDGSHHPWLEERGPRFALLLAVDDATNTVPYALLHQEEDTCGYFLLMEGLIQRHGIPLALYSDRHAVFKHPREPRQSPAGPTQFGRGMQELGITADLRAIAGSERPGGADQRHIPGPAGYRATLGGGRHHGRSQQGPVGFLAALQPAVRSPAATVCQRLPAGRAGHAFG